MHNTPSRKQKREAKFYTIAEKGDFSCNTISLFKGEAKSLIKNGFEVKRYGENEKKSLPSEVNWEKAFQNGIPPIVLNYCVGIIKTFPKSAIENWAQELFVIAARASFEKGNTVGKQLLRKAQTLDIE